MSDSSARQLRVVWLIRHGRTPVPSGRCLGWTDPDLAEPGETRESLASLAESFDGVDAVVSSDLTRADRTADMLADLVEARRATDRRLREMHFGRWEEASWEEIREREPEAFRAYMDNWLRTPAPGGESFQQLAERVRAFWRERAMQLPDEVAIVAHRGSCVALVCHLLGADPADAFRRDLDYAAAWRIEPRSPAVDWQVPPD